jgi:hypothetical protein
MSLHGETQLYLGTVTGYQGSIPAVAMLITADDTPHPVVYFRVVFFLAGAAVVIRGKADDNNERGEGIYAGVAADSRGWDVNWRVRVVGETIAGDYDQPHDRGTIAFRAEV